MEGQHLVRCCLTLSLQLLHLAGTFSLITVFHLHMGFHGGHASHRETICPTGQAHLVIFVDMVVKGLIVSGPECTQRAEVCIYLAAC